MEHAKASPLLLRRRNYLSWRWLHSMSEEPASSRNLICIKCGHPLYFDRLESTPTGDTLIYRCESCDAVLLQRLKNEGGKS